MGACEAGAVIGEFGVAGSEAGGDASFSPLAVVASVRLSVIVAARRARGRERDFARGHEGRAVAVEVLSPGWEEAACSAVAVCLAVTYLAEVARDATAGCAVAALTEGFPGSLLA